ncbi:hypothetical protein G5I_01974 [Acromyrmex echinatior]|uniref:Uncharacterized protein n=1 Tax=Acromyrmex echinatior TaxID=103372 RepID=F4W928_ACREC|nr:hypothetical protein G5I_01974 [Acromyrmex echinatior]
MGGGGTLLLPLHPLFDNPNLTQLSSSCEVNLDLHGKSHTPRFGETSRRVVAGALDDTCEVACTTRIKINALHRDESPSPTWWTADDGDGPECAPRPTPSTDATRYTAQPLPTV